MSCCTRTWVGNYIDWRQHRLTHTVFNLDIAESLRLFVVDGHLSLWCLSSRLLNFTAQEYSVFLRGPICLFHVPTCRTPSLGVETFATRVFSDVLSCSWVRFLRREICFVVIVVSLLWFLLEGTAIFCKIPINVTNLFIITKFFCPTGHGFSTWQVTENCFHYECLLYCIIIFMT